MKKVWLLLCSLPFTVMAQPSRFMVTGELDKNIDSIKIYLAYKMDGTRIVDSALSSKGRFHFNGNIDKGEMLFAGIILDKSRLGFQNLSTRRGGMDIGRLALVAGTVTIKGKDSISTAVITDDLNINREYIEMKETKDLMSFAKKHPLSLVSIEALTIAAGSFPDKFIMIPLFNELSATVQQSKMGKAFVSFLENYSKIVIGSTAPEFTQNDPDGKPVRLSDFRGKYVLLDFWASWCGPCRVANPSLVKIYERLKKMNFTILGISLDREKKEWIDAIKKDNLKWTHVSDLKHFSNSVVLQYGIGAIPQSILIDPSGKIVAKNLSGDELENKLRVLLQ